jgi:C1A family cysteine protease
METYFGCYLSPVDVRDYKIACASSEVLPEKFELDLLPNIKNQGSVSSCVAHASSSILEYHELAAGRKTKLSTNFIYGIQRFEFAREDTGMFLRDACKIICKYGDMLETDCSGNNEVPKCWDKAEKSLADEDKKTTAEAFRIKSYFSCDSNKAIKKAIMNYGPVLASIKWYDSYQPDLGGVLSTKKSGSSCGHAFMIYGWDEKGFKCQNSWGRLWGKSGRFIVPYEIPIKEARCFVDAEDTDIIIPKRNSFLDIIYKIFNKILNLFRKKF